ncbi:IS110 family transposase [Rhizobium sp. VS19-DR104.2]|nr:MULTISPECIES: IS110 family transposase [unclassified Rhizobium]MBZ5762525.1 IS110 family transposase [Rhizobium sp. VS19-DR96]MBZ5768460.1 IS110 family transposase [Rhizobium sp. VS19-DR129.2]MBZ5775978.1 IS110 family transposase [Rhizobium sp. VS19-DRK62.2]MBZ5787250.1 IS110 family transposase [Rhizobium sp. VS19-DR121]MBZ5804603.1 IS110 family transposase [Rhizobium sp. VS19-DR181]
MGKPGRVPGRTHLRLGLEGSLEALGREPALANESIVDVFSELYDIHQLMSHKHEPHNADRILKAVAEAAMRPTMRTVAVKTSEQQARAMVFRTRDLLVGQRTQMVNALRGHLAEHGIIVGRGLDKVDRLTALITSANLPELVQSMARLYLSKIEQLHSEIDEIDRHIAAEARKSDVVRRLQKMPGIGPVCAMAITAFAPSMQEFRSGRDFAAWLGIVPRQHSSGGKQKLGHTSKMGQRDIRRLLIIGAMSVVHWKGRGGGRPGSWLSNMLARKPRMLVAIAMANKMARMIWAMLARNEDYRDPAGAVC